MNGLRVHARDSTLPAAAGEPRLQPPAPAAVLDLVREHLLVPGEPAPVEAEWTYARWKPGVALAAGYLLRWEDGLRVALLAKVYAGDKALHLAARPAAGRLLAHGAPEARLRPWAVPPGGALLLCAFPHDRMLPGLPRALDLHRLRRLAGEAGLFPGRVVRAHRSRAQVLRYRPEARAVLRLDLGLKSDAGTRSEVRLAARVLPPRLAARVAAARAAAPARAPCPRLLHHESRTGLLLEEWLDVDVRAPDDFNHAEAAGRVLARLHLPAPDEPRPEALAAQAPLFAWHPRLAGLAAGARAPRSEGPACWIHGDLHPDQVALSRADGDARLLDLDRLGPGAPTEDLASWLADGLASDPQADLASLAAPLLAGYVAAGGRPPAAQALRTAVAVALVARAAAALRRLQAGAPGSAAELLELARATAPRGTVFP